MPISTRRVSVLVLLALAVTTVLAPPARALAPDGGGEPALRKATFTFTPHRRFERVFLAGTFNGWSTDATPMRMDAGRWEVTVPLAPGEYQYKFVADGEWITDEKAVRFLPDGFGGRNSVLYVDESFEPMLLRRGDGRILLDGLERRGDAWEETVSGDGTVSIRVRTWTGDVERVALRWEGAPEAGGTGRACSGPEGDTMELFGSDGTYDYYRAELTSPSFTYGFELLDGAATALLDREGARAGDALAGGAPFTFDLAREAPFETPDWVKDGIVYQIFPERFANGDPDNDPDFSEWYYEGLTELPASGKTNGEYFHLVENWYDVEGLVRSPYKTDGKPDWNSFYGGDIAGIRQRLDYLSDLGVTILYLNPVFEAKSNHKYDAATYMRVDPHFGTNDELAALVSDCHERGMRVVIDLALNHTGHTHWAFVDAREKGSESEYWDWYEFRKWPVPGGPVATPADASDYYDCWWGFGQMPSLNFDLSRPNSEEESVGDIEDAVPNTPLVDHLLDVARYWLEDVGVDGYRLDVAGEVPLWFWELFRARVREANPEAYIVGELWGASPDRVNGRCFDAVMNYKFFRDPVHEFIAAGDGDARRFDRALAPGRLIYAEQGVQAMMNLLDSHDTERFLTAVGGDERRLKLALLFAMTYVGAPTLYYGDEIGMEGGRDPDCRRPFLWDWAEDPERVKLHDYVRRLVTLRRDHACLRRGDFETLYAEGRVFAFRRSLNGEHAVVMLNAGESDVTVRVPLGERISEFVSTVDSPTGLGMAALVGALDGRLVRIEDFGGGAGVTVRLAPMSGAVFMPRVARIMSHPDTGR